MNDKGKYYGIVDKPSLEQQFHKYKYMVITFVVKKSGAILLTLVVLNMVGWQAEKI